MCQRSSGSLKLLVLSVAVSVKIMCKSTKFLSYFALIAVLACGILRKKGYILKIFFSDNGLMIVKSTSRSFPRRSPCMWMEEDTHSSYYVPSITVDAKDAYTHTLKDTSAGTSLLLKTYIYYGCFSS